MTTERSDFRKTQDTFVEGSTTLPAKFYTSPEVFRTEKTKLFENDWFCVGHTANIPESGDYILAETGDESVIVLRNKNGQVGGLYNVCRHRGTKICEAPGKFPNSIQCSYHAWTYDLEGNLIGAPFTKDMQSFRMEDYPLKKANLKIWDGFIFLNFSDNPTPFEKEFETLLGRFDKWNMGGLQYFDKRVYDVDANWKYIFQNFNECYHCPTIHPLLSKFTDFVSGANDLTDGPFLGGSLELKGESMTVTGRMCAFPLGPETSNGKAYFYTILPNLLLNIHPDYVMFHQLNPVSKKRTIITSQWLFAPEAFDKADFRPNEAIDFWHETNLQDWHVCELAQKGVSSKAYEPGPYSPRESLLAAFDRHYLNVMKEI